MAPLDRLLDEYRHARRHTTRLIDDLDEAAIRWRPHEDSSAIGWHLGHQAAVNHFMVRNLTAAEPSIDPKFDRLFDSATPERDRGDLPLFGETLAYREAIAASTEAIIARIAAGDVGAPRQLATIATGLLRAVVNHEYQHDTWILEVRHTIGHPLEPPAPSNGVVEIEGYWVLAP